jgi:hydroxymethylpyrimidine/phosphomethylpyrimidine kinase
VPAPATALTIAGSDSSGGAGIQADLKAFARCRVYGASAITAVTVQSTRGISAVHVVPPAIVAAQIDAVLDDIGPDAIKIGMLVGAATVHAVADALRGRLAGTPLVIDPVRSASAGGELLDQGALGALIAELLPLATVITPNLPEARALLAHAAHPAAGAADDAELARALLTLGPAGVVLTGGHRLTPGDIFADTDRVVPIEGVHHPNDATHGSGCTHSAALTAQLALGKDPLEAATIAAGLAAEAIRNGLTDVGRGVGPVDVLSELDLHTAAAQRRAR